MPSRQRLNSRHLAGSWYERDERPEGLLSLALEAGKLRSLIARTDSDAGRVRKIIGYF